MLTSTTLADTRRQLHTNAALVIVRHDGRYFRGFARRPGGGVGHVQTAWTLAGARLMLPHEVESILQRLPSEKWTLRVVELCALAPHDAVLDRIVEEEKRRSCPDCKWILVTTQGVVLTHAPGCIRADEVQS